ncbi:VOC family protein [Paenibacillus sp. GYB004]|uniref:VOC family protein n=1 Tax=Paenibacillus sp. GYB004 TaxID=2994393 RepID=UPI002F966B6E
MEHSVHLKNDQELNAIKGEVKGVVTIYIKVSDVARSVHFYRTYLGCDVTIENQGYACLRLPWGPQLELVRTESSPNTDEIRFAIYVPNIEKYRALLMDMDNEVKVDEIFDQGGCGLLFNLYDPDHNKIEVWSGYKGEGENEVDRWIKSQQYE